MTPSHLDRLFNRDGNFTGPAWIITPLLSLYQDEDNRAIYWLVVSDLGHHLHGECLARFYATTDVNAFVHDVKLVASRVTAGIS